MKALQQWMEERGGWGDHISYIGVEGGSQNIFEHECYQNVYDLTVYMKDVLCPDPCE